MAETKEVAVRADRSPAFRDDFDRFFEGVFGRSWPLRFDWPGAMDGRIPRVDILDRDSEIVLHAELPGVSREDLDVSVEDGTVTINTKSKSDTKVEKGDYFRREITRGSYSRSLALPVGVDCSKATATLKDGVLEVRVPKREPSKRVHVQVK